MLDQYTALKVGREINRVSRDRLLKPSGTCVKISSDVPYLYDLGQTQAMDISQGIVGECRTYSDLIHTHEHIFAQLILPLQGTLAIATSLHRFELDDSRIFFLPPRCQHTFSAKNSNKFLVLDIPSFMIVDGESSNIQGGLSTVLDERWLAIRSLMLSEISQ